MIFADPRGKKSSEKSKFDSLRLQLAGKYLHNIVASKGGEDEKLTMNNKKAETWASLLKDQFECMRTKSYSDFAIKIGFGEQWYKNILQPNTKQKIDCQQVIQIFEDCPPAWSCKRCVAQPLPLPSLP
jgi:hypothetical protein